MKKNTLLIVCSSLLFLGLTACGSGGSTSPKQQKTATLTFNTVSSAHSAALLGIQLSAKLPAGVSFSDITTALTGHNDTGQLLGGSYDASNRTITFAVANPSTPIRFGTFAQLKCDVATGFSLDQLSFETINTPFPDKQMTGKDSAGNTVDLSQIPVTLSVTFGY
jgi:hypothetical protein